MTPVYHGGMAELVWGGTVPEAVRNPQITMNTNTKTISPAMLQEDRDAVTAILAMADYTTLKDEFQKEVIYKKLGDKSEVGIRVELAAAEAEYLLKEIAFNDARDKMVALQWKQHEWVLGAREQVAAKFGKSSDQYAATGRKKKSEYKRSGPRGPRSSPPPAK